MCISGVSVRLASKQSKQLKDKLTVFCLFVLETKLILLVVQSLIDEYWEFWEACCH